jgi:hypothetical protein
MADPLQWKEGEGYSIHVLGGKRASKAPVGSFDRSSVPADAIPIGIRSTFQGSAQRPESASECQHRLDYCRAHSTQTKLHILMTARQGISGQGKDLQKGASPEGRSPQLCSPFWLREIF